MSLNFSPSDSSDSLAKINSWIAENVQKVQGGFLCCPCGKIINKKTNMNRHVRDKHLENNICYECPSCKSVHISKHSFQNHIYSKHPAMRGIEISKFAYYKE